MVLFYLQILTNSVGSVDTEGRRAFAVLEKGTNTFIFNCIYAPNDHNINYFANVYEQMAEQLTSFPNAVPNIFGDFNIILEYINGVNRQKSNIASKLIEDNNKILNLVDTFCKFNPACGFTWVRYKCGSIHDIIFSSR